MHLDLPHLTYSGPTLDDEPLLARLPPSLAEALRRRNGCVAYLGGLHVRGACSAPAWHSLRAACDGPDAFHLLYPDVHASDVPFAEDGFGNQFLLRDGAVYELRAEAGEIERVAESMELWWAAVLAEPEKWLPVQAALTLAQAGTRVPPGQLILAYPPFVLAESAEGVSLRAIPALEHRRWLAGLAAQIRDLPDGATIEIKAPPCDVTSGGARG